MSKQQSAHTMFGTNKNLENGKGVTLDYPGFSITIHRAGGANKKFNRVLQEKMKPHRQSFERGLLDEETSHKIMLETYAESVVIGWEGDIGPKGKKTPFSVENCVKVLNELPDLFDEIKEQSAKASTFRDAQEALEEKN